MERSGDVQLRLARNLPQFAQTLDLLLQFSITGVDALPPLGRKLGDHLVKKFRPISPLLLSGFQAIQVR